MQGDDKELQQIDDAPGTGAPPVSLVAYWQAQASVLIPPGDKWRALAGGRTNAVWSVPSPGGALVVKLYRAAAATPLFGNDPDAERASLTALAGSGLAPDLIATGHTPAGRSIVYAHVAGRTWRNGDDPIAVARALAHLHSQPLAASLPQLPAGAKRLRREARSIADTLGRAAEPVRSHLDLSVESALPAGIPAFIHGDPTAANTLLSDGGIRFIDWQCPGFGDPADDLAVFLSPAMQIVSGNAPLSAEDSARFLDAYQEAAPHGSGAVARYRAHAPLYHVRMAAYALWRAQRGDRIYAEAADAEIEAIRAAGRARQRPAR